MIILIRIATIPCFLFTASEILMCPNQITQELFAAEIIPQYFDHNKFSSFARQLNFYGFRKIQTKPIRNEDFDRSTAKHVTFFNEKFKRGRYDLLKEIQRSTRGGGAQASLADQAREMDTLRSTVVNLEQRVLELDARWQETQMKMDREIQAKVELAMMDLLSSRQGMPSASALQAQYMGMPQLPTSFGDASILQRAERSFGSIGRNTTGNWENPLVGAQAARAFSTASASSGQGNLGSGGQGGGAGATLPPHPKQKSLPPPTMGLPNTMSGDVMSNTSGSMRNINGNMGAAGGRNLSTATNSSLLRSAWEDKFFSTLMMTDGASRAASLAGLQGAAGMAGGNVSGLAALAAAQQHMQQNQNNAAGYAAFMHDRAQRGASLGMRGGAPTGGGGGGGGGSADSMKESLKRQTTAEILLEAAGELKAKGGDGGDTKTTV